ncbi:MAG: DUF262 domain-containing protein [Limnothrix sp. CACIAM 69d]|nr:MAG: DUF262 domain-containing protein [Limnothrix sp. CACIAM 69d]
MNEIHSTSLNNPSDEITSDEEQIEDLPYKNKTERRLNTQPYDYAVRSLVDMVIDGELILNPEYQRQYVWDDGKASRFIESLLLNIPVPVIYLNEESDGRYTVIDGQQRLTSLLRFTRPDELESLSKTANLSPLEPLILTKLKVRADLDGLGFRQLEYSDKTGLNKRHLRCIVILNESDPNLKFEVFERLNTGSVALSDQEIRNCVYRGAFNNLLSKCASLSQYQELIRFPMEKKKQLKDQEFVLRFFAYRDLPPDYNDNYAEYLSNYMEQYRIISSEQESNLLKLFEKTVNLIHKILTPNTAFRKPKDANDPEQGWSTSFINGAIYESQMIVYSCLPDLSQLSHEQINSLRKATHGVFAEEIYSRSIYQGTARKERVLRRTRSLYDAVRQVINDIERLPMLQSHLES